MLCKSMKAEETDTNEEAKKFLSHFVKRALNKAGSTWDGGHLRYMVREVCLVALELKSNDEMEPVR